MFKILNRYLYAGYFTLSDFFLKINPRRIKTRDKSINHIKARQYNRLFRNIYKRHIMNVLDDLIDNKTVYLINLNRNQYTLQMEEMPEYAKISKYKLNKTGGWDPIKSYLKYYCLTFRGKINGGFAVKHISAPH